MKEMYQQAVAESERITKTNPTEEIQHSTHARSIKERFERGEPIATSDGEDDSKPKQDKADEEVIAAGKIHCPTLRVQYFSIVTFQSHAKNIFFYRARKGVKRL